MIPFREKATFLISINVIKQRGQSDEVLTEIMCPRRAALSALSLPAQTTDCYSIDRR